MPEVSPLIIVLAITLLISPFFITLAAKQDQKTKYNLRIIWIFLLLAQLTLGFFNWENFTKSGKSGLELAILFPDSLLNLFFIISLSQILLLLMDRLPYLPVVLNFINSIILFAAMIRLSNVLGQQIVSFFSVGVVFVVLVGNVISLILINKDKNLLKKYL